MKTVYRAVSASLMLYFLYTTVFSYLYLFSMLSLFLSDEDRCLHVIYNLRPPPPPPIALFSLICHLLGQYSSTEIERMIRFVFCSLDSRSYLCPLPKGAGITLVVKQLLITPWEECKRTGNSSCCTLY